MKPSACVQSSIEVLEELFKNPIPADLFFKRYFKSKRYIGSGDRKNIAELVYDILRHREKIEWVIKQAASWMRITPRSMVLAKLFMDKKLELFTSESEYQPKPISDEEKRFLSALKGVDISNAPLYARCSFQKELEPYLKRAIPNETFIQEMDALNSPAYVDFRVNTIKCDREYAKKILIEDGLEIEETKYSPYGLRVVGSKRPSPLNKALKDGLVEVQDEGSQLVALISPVKPGMTVVDYCAGAGGKTLALAAMMKNRGRIYAMDVSDGRLEGAVARLRKAGVSNTTCLAIDSKWLKRHKEGIDCVLVDAPCSGTGTWRRNPDMKSRNIVIEELLQKQSMILDQVQPLIKEGGFLVYATCSVLMEENEDQIEKFLQKYPNYIINDLSKKWQFESQNPITGQFLKLSPYKSGTDGFFTAVLERIA